ncbi:hypothetical protein CYY_002360 [Polysphondylium violaceum]|uniref:Glycoside hydrolase family 5 domain-containing protein n=1 Tax=Polysphondylium violaceum TaxID=133409 RepID=A0A8J4Q0A4_9MYCE|nr:hypothetical protein CYY_002360 [Polysphondylium violaceum]
MKKSSLLAIAILATLCLSSAVLAGEMSTAGLYVDGKYIKNEDNEILMLRGANRPGTEYSCVQYAKIFDGPYDAAHVHEIRNWKINVLRVPLNEDCWLGTNGPPESFYFGEQYRESIKKYVDMITSNNVAVIVDLHWASHNGTLATEQVAMPNNKNSITFWGQVADTFKSNSRVIFDLYNEPFPYGNTWDSEDAWQCWKDGTKCDVDNVTGMQQMVDAIRETGAKNIILLSGIQYATSFTRFIEYIPFDPLKQLGAALHSYDFNYCRSKGCWDVYLRPIYESYPLVATETGQKDCLYDFLLDFLHYCDKNSIHYLAWSWLTGDCNIPSLIQDYMGTPSNFGKGYKHHLDVLGNGEEPWWSDSFDMYNDKLTHWVDNWSTGDNIVNATAQTYAGKYSIQFTPSAEKSLHLMCWDCIKNQVHKSLEFWIHGGASGNQNLKLDLLKLQADKTNNIAQSYDLSNIAGGPIPPNKWVKVVVDLTTLPRQDSYDGFWLKADTDQPDIYVDSITVRAINEPPPDDFESSALRLPSPNTLIVFLFSILYLLF